MGERTEWWGGDDGVEVEVGVGVEVVSCWGSSALLCCAVLCAPLFRSVTYRVREERRVEEGRGDDRRVEGLALDPSPRFHGTSPSRSVDICTVSPPAEGT